MTDRPRLSGNQEWNDMVQFEEALEDNQRLRAEVEQLTHRAIYAERVWRELGASRKQLQAENERLTRQVAGMRATLTDFADPDHWEQNDDGQWIWHGYYPPFERPAVDLLGTLDTSPQSQEQPAREHPKQ
jgi:hypothetical protein